MKDCLLSQPIGDASEVTDRAENSQVDSIAIIDPPKTPTSDALLNVTDSTGASEPTSSNDSGSASGQKLRTESEHSSSTESDLSASSGQCSRKLSMWKLRPPPSVASKPKTAFRKKLNAKLKHSKRLSPDQFLNVSASKQSLMSQFLSSSKVDGVEPQALQ